MVKKTNTKKAKNTKRVSQMSRKPRRQTVPYGLAVTPRDVEAACSQFDAFCPAGYMAKIMDEDSELSVAYQVRYVLPITTNASGSVKMDINCLLKQAYRNSGTIVGNAVTVDGPWTAVPEQTALEGSFASYRFVSWGVRLFSTASGSNCQGLITTKVHASAVDLENITWSSIQQRFDPVNGVSTTFLAKRRGSASRLYIPTNETWSTGYRFPTDTLAIWATGCTASTTVAHAEIIYNLECIPLNNTIASRTATPAAASNNRITEASGNAAAQLPSLFSSLPSSLVKTAMRQALIYGGQAVGGIPGALIGASLSGNRAPSLLNNVAVEVD
jgi:hypothetical protein